MDGLVLFGRSIAGFLDLTRLAYIAASTLLGIIIGALPGLTATMGVALVTTLTLKMESNVALLVLICVYVGAIYRGSRSAILLNIPGRIPAAVYANNAGFWQHVAPGRPSARSPFPNNHSMSRHMKAAPSVSVRAIELLERDVTLRLPFRFGVVTLTAAPQAFVRAKIRMPDGREGWGMAADLLAPKWFDKNLALSNEDNFQQLRDAILIAARAYTSDGGPRPAFGHFSAHYDPHLDTCGKRGLNPLVASFGPALIDRAILDGLCRLLGLTFFDAIRRNMPGIDVAPHTPDLAGFHLDKWLASLSSPSTLDVRHTVGLVDPIRASDVKAWRKDGLPETLEQVVQTYGHSYFKIKVGGDLDEDLARLTSITGVLDTISTPYHVTLDGNEQYDIVQGVSALWARIAEAPRLKRFAASVLFIEQPIARVRALSHSVESLARRKPLLIDESDGDLTAFPQAKTLGYTGVSTKACKGLYKSILNGARCAHWNATERGRYFLSAEDLTCQAGVAVQQDLAIVALLGLGHVERNGHHYVDGMAGIDESEQRSFLIAHPDLYEKSFGAVRLRIAGGMLSIGSLACPGLGVGAEPMWSGMRRVFIEGFA